MYFNSVYVEYRVSSADFEKRYKELVRRRSELNKLNDICELKHKELEDISLKHVHIHKKLIAFKTDLEEVRNTSHSFNNIFRVV